MFLYSVFDEIQEKPGDFEERIYVYTCTLSKDGVPLLPLPAVPLDAFV